MLLEPYFPGHISFLNIYCNIVYSFTFLSLEADWSTVLKNCDCGEIYNEHSPKHQAVSVRDRQLMSTSNRDLLSTRNGQLLSTGNRQLVSSTRSARLKDAVFDALCRWR